MKEGKQSTGAVHGETILFLQKYTAKIQIPLLLFFLIVQGEN